MALIKQGAAYTRAFYLGEAGVSPVVLLSKAGGAFAPAFGVINEISDGWYKIALIEDDTDTLGDLAYHITAVGADGLDMCDQVVAAAVGSLTDAARDAVVDAVWDELLTGESHNTPASAGRRLRQVKEVAHEGTAQGGGPSTITLAAGASDLDNYYYPALIVINAGAGAGQSRRIDSYAGATHIATVATPWITQPNATSEYTIFPWGSVRVSDIDTGPKQEIRQEIDANSTRLAAIEADTQDIQTQIGAAGAGLTALGDARLANLDAKVSTRLATAGYTAPDNAGITAIKAKTDALPAQPAAVGDIPTAVQNADALLKRDMEQVTGEADRSPLNALRPLRNKVVIQGNTLIVCKENDLTPAWTAGLTTDPAAQPITSIDPI